MFLFGVLGALDNAFGGGLESGDATRLRMIHKISVVEELPRTYYQRIVDTEGVATAAYVSWVGGEYQDPNNFFVTLAVSETFLDLHREYLIDTSVRERWQRIRTGALVGRGLADRFGWQVGDRIPISRALYEQADGSRTWEFTLEGVFDGADEAVDESQLFFHHEYLEEASPWGQGTVRWFEIETVAGRDPATVAKRLDAEFATSGEPTKTSTESAFLTAFANQVGDIALIITSVVGVTFFVILLVVANALLYSVRERLSELAVLKALGFTNLRVMGLVLAECGVLCGGVGILGLAAAYGAVRYGVPTMGMTSVFRLTVGDVGEGLLMIVGLTLAGAIVPAATAFKLHIAATLAR